MRKSTISTLTLATLLCVSSNNYALVGSAYAASKSAISPDINLAQPISPAVQSQPAIAPIQNDLREIKAPEVPIDNSADNREGIQIKVESNSNIVLPTRSEPTPQISEPVEVVLENRSTGCKFKASSMLERDSDYCNPTVAVSRDRQQNYSQSNYQGENVLYAASSGETALQVRRLTPQEIAAMSLPSNGDKQMLFPLISPSIVSSIFGSRVHPVTGQVRFHQGTDLAAAEGTPVVAAFSGRVEIAGWLGGYGLIVVISHGDTHETRYAHLSEVLVKAGEEVKQGTVIGLVGSTGLATGPHLHFELWRKMKEGMVAIDPTPQLILAMEQLQKYLAQSPKSSNKA
ncbi:M23 family metallopeptidase [Pseudanabaena sp. FACHB-1998]|uniref:M23 family metallopeptidase n=1 Tax=Pseudanabaena sp. FACHB-1998 TaxID=2692858 RepID=UPI0016803B58|nr:M23 family metallopeptidase [Pseudanabaena sp. FACHB-1998]MBD2176082.1 M23 family metallopeptidase [Pseudanabaena sp. FACHB-1998]